jgi:heptose-I-phosphate ethanolaminephosphotransferase
LPIAGLRGRTTLAYRAAGALLAAWIVLMALPPALYQRLPVPAAGGFAWVVAAGYIALTLILAILLAGSRIRWKSAFAAFVAVILVLELLLHGKLDRFGVDSVRELLNANSQEFADYVGNFFLTIELSRSQVAAVVLSCLPALLLRLTEKPVEPRLRAAVTAAGMLSIACILLAKLAFAVPGYARGYHGIERYAANVGNANRSLAGALARERDAPHIVVYIGESAAKDNWSLYGYYNDTTQPLKDLRPELIVFSDVVSPYSHTFQAVYRALTVARDPYLDQFSLVEDLQRASLVDTLNAAGLATSWLSTHNVAGSWDWPSQLFGRQAASHQFLNRTLGSVDGSRRIYDSALVELHLKAPSGAGRVDFLHTYAGHFDYCRNIPERDYLEFDDPLLRLPHAAAFGGLKGAARDSLVRNIRCYDAAIRHVAGNLAAVLGKASRSEAPTVLVYFADHGEDVFGATSHESGLNSFRHLDVPFFVYFNAAAKRAFAAQYRAALANKDAPYSLEWISDSLLDLAGFRHSRPLLSVFSPGLKAPPRYSLARRDASGDRRIVAIDEEDAGAQHGYAPAGDDYYRKRRLLKRLAPPDADKVCSHATDSVMKWKDAARVFRCARLQVRLDVPGGEIRVAGEPRSGDPVRLRDLLAFGAGEFDRLWLSAGNLDADNAGMLVDYLNGLIPPPRRSRVSIETANGTGFERGARAIRKAGYRLSWRLPAQAAACAGQAGDAACAELKDRAAAAMIRIPFDGLAFDASAFGFVSSLGLPSRIELQVTDRRARRFEDIDRALLAASGLYAIPFATRFDR